MSVAGRLLRLIIWRLSAAFAANDEQVSRQSSVISCSCHLRCFSVIECTLLCVIYINMSVCVFVCEMRGKVRLQRFGMFVVRATMTEEF